MICRGMAASTTCYRRGEGPHPHRSPTLSTRHTRARTYRCPANYFDVALSTSLTHMDSPASQEDKLDLVTRFIRDIRRVARKLGEGGAPFSELQDLYQLAEVFQTNETDEDLFSIRFQLWQTVKHTYRVIAPCGIGGDGPPWSTVLELLKEAELLAKEVGNAKRRVKRHRSRFPHSGPLPSSLLGDSALSHTPSHDYQSHSTPFQSRSLPQLYNRADLVGLEDSSTPHPSQIQHTERGPAAYHQHPGPRHFSDDTSYHYFPSERSHIDISHSQRSRLPAGLPSRPPRLLRLTASASSSSVKLAFCPSVAVNNSYGAFNLASEKLESRRQRGQFALPFDQFVASRRPRFDSASHRLLRRKGWKKANVGASTVLTCNADLVPTYTYPPGYAGWQLPIAQI
ncbi:hypothetical protein CC85DRAFT_291936 [Cutaneotrichosporon oleaginosum]|uniref:Uncharacterized protein n=1 Tax=Cutaneotrichosporon oleaginosum TaxID=879819 RepID=A0A0J0XNK6_9TREE|nr:uncharacterized protein CC85DRAFT_291936 [Cutaneotrichosporon oleaginosum]KLT42715.1 hypothetical protein CC85DRAFT_291936 [Cutaneotrichosporon oleaginosum]TXT09566.1 hypothetical protein COLE_03500 [Cutaneotrichosporon oleaginosum]